MISLIQYLKNQRKVLGMNDRNLNYVRPYNLKKARRIADDKLLSKKILRKNGIPVPGLIAKIKDRQQLEQFDWKILPSSFALKPNRGFGGEGILVVYGKKKDRDDAWVKADGSVITVNDIKNHVLNILEGSYSLAHVPDVAFFEERLTLLKLFKPYSFKGIPDIRVIVFNRVPVMAMLRLPTKDSGGKANLHQGAIGVGIDLATGTTTSAVQGKGKIVEYIPGTRLLLSGIRIPYWTDILKLAVKSQEVTGLGFLGADVSIDRERGPVFLELNARPGLSIQVANLDGLKDRLNRVQGIKIKTIERGVRIGMSLFGGEIEEELESISGRKIIGPVEKIKITGKNGEEIEVDAKIDTGAFSTSIDEKIAGQLGFSDVIEYFSRLDLPQEINQENYQEIEKEIKKKYLSGNENLEDISVVFSSSGITVRPKVKINFVMDKEGIVSRANIIDRANMKYPVIIGRRDLNKFLVDVKKTKTAE